MDKRTSLELDRVFREISGRRDRRLGGMAPIESQRRALLVAELRREFPLETLLRETAQVRDRLLSNPRLQIPSRVVRTLAAVGSGKALSWVHRPAVALLLAACLVAAFVSLGGWGWIGAREEATASLPPARASVASSTSAPPNRLRLRMSAPELAALRTSFLAVNRPAAGEEGPARLRLDLPVRTLLGGEEIAKLP